MGEFDRRGYAARVANERRVNSRLGDLWVVRIKLGVQHV